MNLIINAFAFKENYGSSMQLNNRSDMEKLSIYMKDLAVSLISAKKNNPDDTVMLIATDMPFSPYKEMLEKENIEIRIVPFDRYVMPKDFCWALAFYKLCVLKEVSSWKEYEHILLMDTDTVTMGSYAQMWQEASYGVMLYDIHHTFEHKDRGIIKTAYANLYPGVDETIIHYGGEYICGTPDDIEALTDCTDKVMEDVKKAGYNIPKDSSDEVILSIAAVEYRKNRLIIDAGAYIYRYWTENMFYLVSTNTVFNPVCIWHFPVEKDLGFLLLFDYYTKYGCFPDRKKTARMLGIAKAKRPFSLYTYRAKLKRKLLHSRIGK